MMCLVFCILCGSFGKIIPHLCPAKLPKDWHQLRLSRAFSRLAQANLLNKGVLRTREYQATLEALRYLPNGRAPTILLHHFPSTANKSLPRKGLPKPSTKQLSKPSTEQLSKYPRKPQPQEQLKTQAQRLFDLHLGWKRGRPSGPVVQSKKHPVPTDTGWEAVSEPG